MLPELGEIALLFATVFSALQFCMIICGFVFKRGELIKFASWVAYFVFFAFLVALLALAAAFAQDDYSVLYIAQHSNSQLPVFYKIAATWGGHEGSMLFFVFSLSFWNMLVAACSKTVEPVIKAYVLAILGFIVFLFALFVVVNSNPFIRQFPPPFEGRDLNPMLQDIALIFHPPLLYFGYVGFAVNFAYAGAALLNRRIDSALVSWSRPWAWASWGFLTVGIALGSWWAYYELGWGGWWFWDPVENASLLPWLLGTALLHAMVVCEKRGSFGHAVLLLSIFTFSFSILGTFVVRSGLLSSVHAFASDPGRGLSLLLLLSTILTAVLTLFAFRAPIRPPYAQFSLLSKEVFLGIAIILFCVAAMSVFIGTFYPWFYSLFGFGSLSVGAPYFNRLFVPLCLAALIIMPFSPTLRWKKLPSTWLKAQIPWLVLALFAGSSLCVFRQIPTTTFIVLLSTASFWVVFSHSAAWFQEKSLQRSLMYLAHIGIGLTVLGAAQVSQFSDERWLGMTLNQSYPLAGYNFTIVNVEPLIGSNYTSEQLFIRVDQDGKFLTHLYPEKRHYNVRQMTMNETGIDWGVTRDLFATIGEKISRDTYSVHLQYKPMARWIWLGAALMALGSILQILNHMTSRAERK